MSGSNGNGRIQLLGKQAAKQGKHNATLDEATEIAQRVAVQVVEHYMQQVPGLVGKIVEGALLAYHQSVTQQAPELTVNAEKGEEVSPEPEPPPVTYETEDGRPLENANGTPFTGTAAGDDQC